MSSHGDLQARRGLALPADWDAERDLLVWIGPLPAEPGTLPRGPRILWVPAGEASAAAPAGLQLVRSPGEIFEAVLRFTGVFPRHALVHRCDGVSLAAQKEVAAALKNALRSKAMQQKTIDQSGATWLRQGLANLSRLAQHPSITALRSAFAQRPCVLVSPGPSLAKNVAELRDLSRRALIVSGTHALHALAHAGVTPHLVVCADPGDLARHWAGLALEEVEAFVIGATCRPETFAVPARRIFSFASNGALDGWVFEPLGEAPNLAAGGSVSCSMLSLALHLGCDPIVLVGQDLSFTERFYAAGGLDGDATVTPAAAGEFVLMKEPGAEGPGTTLADGSVRFTIPQRILEVPGWNGGVVRTTPALKSFLDWFEAVAPTLKGDTRLVNCTEGGARIAGMEHLPLGEASASWSEGLAVAEVLDRAQRSCAPAARRRALQEWTERTLRGLEPCLELARRCRARTHEARLDTRELGRLEKKLSRALREVPLVSLVAQADISAARERARLARTLEENLSAARSLYAVVEQAGELLRAPLRAAWSELGGTPGSRKSSGLDSR